MNVVKSLVRKDSLNGLSLEPTRCSTSASSESEDRSTSLSLMLGMAERELAGLGVAAAVKTAESGKLLPASFSFCLLVLPSSFSPRSAEKSTDN